ncbi:MAG: RnfABCDGE type electron transport complex subunit G [bacterium]|nr:RnfABCDGE type electron transport complex subunit G [bacterium]
MGKIIKLGLVLFIITAVTGLILGAVHTITLAPIREAQAREKNEALAATLPGATEFKELPPQADAGIIKEIYEGSDGGKTVGYNFTVTPKGYGGPLELIIGISSEGRVMDIKILSHSETPGLGAKAVEEPFAGQFKNKLFEKLSVTKTPAEAEDQIQAISGATITSSAVVKGVNDALACWKANFSGGASDSATGEEAN